MCLPRASNVPAFDQLAAPVGPPLLIHGGVVVNADTQVTADVLMENGIIIAIGSNLLAPPNAIKIDASGKYVMPGGIEPHTHLEMPFMGQEACDDFFSGQAAALAGGTTMHIDFALPLNGSIREGYHIYRKKAEKSCMDYGFHMAVTQWNDDVDKEMEYAVQQGINSFKFFMAYKGALMVNDDQLARGMYRCKELGALPMVHAENGDMVALGQEMIFAQGIHGPEGHALSRPDVLETEATGRAVRISEVVGTPLYVVHVQSKGAAEEIAAGNARGARVIGEPILPGLALDESRLWDRNWTKAAAYVMSPPIRKQSVDGAALRHALASGLLHLVGTDHAVFNSTQKAAGRHDFRKIPNGVNGIEERMHVTWELMVNSGLMSPSDFVRVTSTAAAKIFNIFPRKGVIAVGSDADVILFDPSIHHTLSAATHHSRVDMNVFEGMNITGKVITTISRGRIVWNDGRLNVQPHTGRYIPLPPCPPHEWSHQVQHCSSSLFHGLAQRDMLRAEAANAPVWRD